MRTSEIKTVVFLSNFFNHHQKPFSEAMFSRLGNGYTFVETEEMPDERKKLGYNNDNKPLYVMHYSDSACQDLIDQADVVIWGSAPESLIYNRKRECKLTFRYSERIYKEKAQQIYKLPVYFYRFRKIPQFKRNFYLLCASAYAAADYAKARSYMNAAYKWGYFPETRKYEDVDALIRSKDPKKILWCGRFLDWKHPDDMIFVAKALREDGYDFRMELIGTGEMEDRLHSLIDENGLQDHVHMLGSMSPEKVRERMEEASIYLFTSDRQEGWGAVLNESMNSACAVVASHAIGATPFLIEHQKNGLIYRDGDRKDLYKNVKLLLDCPQQRMELSKQAYKTIVDEWNAENAAEKVLKLSETILNGEDISNLYDGGICSKAEIIKDNWWK